MIKLKLMKASKKIPPPFSPWLSDFYIDAVLLSKISFINYS
jgi:hypothetical protein